MPTAAAAARSVQGINGLPPGPNLHVHATHCGQGRCDTICSRHSTPVTVILTSRENDELYLFLLQGHAGEGAAQLLYGGRVTGEIYGSRRIADGKR